MYDWKIRCDVCDLPCSSTRGISIHKSKSHQCDKVQNFTDTLVIVKVCKIIEQQAQRLVIHCGGEPLENVFRSKYLVTIFTTKSRCQGEDRVNPLEMWTSPPHSGLKGPVTHYQAETIPSSGDLWM